jgi:sec-independent protein translocase protein TatC
MGAERTATFAEHVQELRRRIMWTLLFVAIGAGVGYALHDKILQVLQSPLNEKLYYTTPTGAFSFIIKICCVFGLVVALPMLVYQIFAFFQPLIEVRTRGLMVLYVLGSVVLAGAGMVFAYFISLPAALHFLVNFGSDSGSIQALITANEYFNFVFAYIAGFAVLFQIPLIILFINKVTPLKPKHLFGATRYVVLGSFIISAIITPTPDPFNQALMAGPIILLYFMTACVVAVLNRPKRLARRAAKKLPKPEPVLNGIPDLVAGLPDMSATAAAITTKPARRLASDMVVSGRKRSVPTYNSRPQGQIQRLQPAVQSRSTARLINDFVPASAPDS